MLKKQIFWLWCNAWLTNVWIFLFALIYEQNIINITSVM